MLSRARERLTFQSRKTELDGGGNTVGEWVNRFESYVRVRPRFGGESVQAARLAGITPVTIIMRSTDKSRMVTPEWRAYDQRDTTRIYNLRSIVNADERNQDIEILAELGVAT